MRIVTTLPQDDLNKVSEAARQAEADGYDGVVTLENRHDPFLPLAVAATVTDRLELATGIAISFSRSPMVVANMGWDLQKASRGRVSIGLGSQIRPHNEKRFSVPWSPPAPRMKEYVEALRAIWTCWGEGGKLDYRGKHYTFTLMTPNFVPEPLEGPPPKVTLAAVGPAMLKVAGEVADGVRLHPFCSRAYLEQVVVPRLEQGLATRGLGRADFEIHGGGFVATGPDDESVARMMDWVRMRIGFYGSTPAYWPVLELHDLGDLGRKLNAMSKQGRWQEMTAEIDDDLVHLMAAVGRHDQIAGAIARHFGGVADVVAASASSELPGGLPPEVIQDIQRI